MSGFINPFSPKIGQNVFEELEDEDKFGSLISQTFPMTENPARILLGV